MRAPIVNDSRALTGIPCRNHYRNGSNFCEARDGLWAVKVLAGDADDICLSWPDFNMPEMDGIGLLKAVHRRNPFKTLSSVIIITGTSLQTVAAALDVGAEYIMKPFTSDAVVEKLGMIGVLEAVSA